MVIVRPLSGKDGTDSRTSSSSFTRPLSTSCITAIAVTAFETEPML
jgi:hypothetical protein